MRFQFVVRPAGNAKAEDWLDAVGRIAALSPPLLILESNKVVNFAAIEMEISAAIETPAASEADTQAARRYEKKERKFSALGLTNDYAGRSLICSKR